MAYSVVFKLNNLTLVQQHKVYELLMKNLSFEEKAGLEIEVIDFLGGKHYPLTNKGVMPDKTKCEYCINIDCSECLFYQVKKEMEKENELD